MTRPAAGAQPMARGGAVAAPDVSVVIVNYNAGPFLTACLASFSAKAGGASVETVVVDNASRDGSTAAAQA